MHTFHSIRSRSARTTLFEFAFYTLYTFYS